MQLFLTVAHAAEIHYTSLNMSVYVHRHDLITYTAYGGTHNCGACAKYAHQNLKPLLYRIHFHALDKVMIVY